MSLFTSVSVEITDAAATALAEAGVAPDEFLTRHYNGDWGVEGVDVQHENTFALDHEQAVFSTYQLNTGTDILVTTDGKRTCTRVLLATEHPFRKVNTRQGYALWSAFYDTEKNPLIAVEEPVVAEVLATLSAKHALDVGTGTGRHALRLARSGIQVTALDQSLEMLDVAQQAARDEGLKIDFRVGSLNEGLPFAANQFDLLISALMLCHIPNLAQAIKEFYRVLQPEGYLLITDFHPEAVARGWKTEFHTSGARYFVPTMPHTRAEHLAALATAGFHIHKVIDIPVSAIPNGYALQDFLRKNAEQLFCLVILAQKLEVGTIGKEYDFGVYPDKSG